ncbi:MAG TPA: glycosyltransferase family 39 protein, partial [Dyella sp.]|uniref:glycosyltransferase family 39 protein n=1 Tax=Dyella sp. TaxID=1869338 RepID=UPI002D076FBF
FGLWLPGLRLFSVLAQAAVIVISGLMVRELGGGRMAQSMAAIVVALSPLPLFEGTEFQYTSFDYLWWVLTAYWVIRLLKTEDPRWWLAIGAAIGAGAQTKYTIFFFAAGIFAGLLFTPERRFFRSTWLWAGVALALLIFLPNLIWQARHGFIYLRFVQAIHARDVSEGRADHFFLHQVAHCTNPFTLPLWLAGLYGYLQERRYRLLGWMYRVPLALLVLGQGRGYYLGAAYPRLFAMGAVMALRWLASPPQRWRRVLVGVLFVGFSAYGLGAAAAILPLASSGPLMRMALKHNDDLCDELGWESIVQTVANIRDALPSERRANVGVLVGNYGEQGAIDILGPRYHLPVAISPVNSAWSRGYPVPTPATLIVLGSSREWVERYLTGCRLAAHVVNPYGVSNEESRDHPDIFVCGPPRMPWPAFWQAARRFG